MSKEEKPKLRFSDIVRRLNDENERKAEKNEPNQSEAAESEHSSPPQSSHFSPPSRSPQRPLPNQPSFGSGHSSGASGAKFQSPSATESPRAIPEITREESLDMDAKAKPGVTQALIGNLTGSDEDEEEEFDIYRYLAVIMRRKMIIFLCIVAVGLFSSYAYFTGKKFYTASARMLYSPGSQEIVSDNMISWEPWGTRDKKLHTHMELLKTDKAVLQRVSDDLDGRVGTGQISGGLTVTRGETKGQETDIIELRFRHTDPDLARDVLNNLCRHYVSYIREVKGQDITAMVSKLETQIAKVEGELKEKEDALRLFKENNGLVRLTAETDAQVTKLADMEIAMQQTQLDLLENKERLETIQRQINRQKIDVVTSITYQDLYRNRLSELEFELNTLLAEYSQDHFKVQKVQQEIEQIKEAIRSNIQTKTVQSETFTKNPIREGLLQELVTLTINKASLEAKRTAQEQIHKRLDDDMLKLPLLEQRYASLQRETETLVQTLAMLKGQHEKAKIKRDSQETDLKILQLADTPRVGINEVKVNRIYMGLVVGLVLGIALAFLLEYLDQTIKEPRDVERGLELPLLGIVPLLEGEKAVINFAADKGKARLEPFRVLRTNIKHLANVHKMKTLIVCSGVKGEGKTTLALNLAITFAMDSKKVILVDGDLRRPQIHGLLGVPKENGFSDYMTGVREDIRQVIKPTEYQNLSIVTSGERPHHPTELLGTQRFDQMVEDLKQHADIVIFDSPALLPVSDAITMAPKMDGCVIVTRTLWTPIKAARQAKLQLERIGAKLMGTILNGISHSRGYYPYYYGYYRYYSYKYSYEYEDEPKKRLTLRQWGLNVESKVRAAMQEGAHSMPRYVAGIGRFSRHLTRRKTFWVLMLLFAASLVLSPWLQTKRLEVFGSDAKIEYVGRPKAGVSNNQGVTVAGVPLEAIRTNETSGGRMDNRQNVGPNELGADRVEEWFGTIRDLNAPECIGFYDSLAFEWPEGGFDKWKVAVAQRFAQEYSRYDTVLIGELETKRVKDGFAQATTRVDLVVENDTISTSFVQIWKERDGIWKIIREKRGGES